MDVKLSKYRKELEAIVDSVLDSKGLKTSNLRKERKVLIDDSNNSINIVLNSYIKYIESGRKPRAAKIPIYALIQFIKRRGIRTNNINNLAYAIQTAIYKRGIRGKGDILKLIVEQSAKLIKEKTTKELTDFIRKELNIK